MPVRYENHGLYLINGTWVAGVGTDTINASLDTWFKGVHAQILSDSLDSEFTQYGFKTLKWASKVGFIGEALEEVIVHTEMRLYSNGNVEFVVNEQLFTSQTLTDITIDTLAEAGIGAAIKSAILAYYGPAAITGVVVVLGIAITSGLIWDGLKGTVESIDDLVHGTQDIEVQFFNETGYHIASAVYPQGDDYKGTVDAMQFLAAKSEFSLAGGTIKFNTELGHIDDGLEYQIGQELYERIADGLDINLADLFSVSLNNEQATNTDFMLLNHNLERSYYYPVNGTSFAFNIPVVINGIVEVYTIYNIYKGSYGDHSNLIAGEGQFGQYSIVIDSNDHNFITLVGVDKPEIIIGGKLNDHLFGNVGDDILLGGAGNDIISVGDNSSNFGSANIVIDGGTGIDLADFSNTTHNPTVDLTNNTATINHLLTSDTYNIFNIENIQGGFGQNIIHGDASDNTISGGHKDDHLHGNAGNDILEGRAGNDFLSGGANDDTYIFTLQNYGQDTITDSEGNNKLQFGDIELLVSEALSDGQGNYSYYDSTNKRYYTFTGLLDNGQIAKNLHDINNLRVTVHNSTTAPNNDDSVIINGFLNGDFGINVSGDYLNNSNTHIIC